MKNVIASILADSLQAKETSIKKNRDGLLRAAQMLADCMSGSHKVLIFGNGGSAADAQHLAAEFVNRFQIERTPLPAMALTTDTSILTSIGNDYTFEEVFAKQIAALGAKGDLAWGISTSGNARNVLAAMSVAKAYQCPCISFTGPGGGKLARIADLALKVPGNTTADVQEAQFPIYHLLCKLIEAHYFPAPIR